MRLKVDNGWFKDEFGRTRILRGVNLSGNAKLPYPNGATHIADGFFDHRNVSFVGRPFPLDQADEHFTRLKSWGLSFLRFLITWEAIEHEGPGMYDEAYLDYITAIIQKAGEYDIYLFIDPHQDAWSRFSGGDGAPGWTFDAIGMDITKFKETGAAIVHQTHGHPFPRMIWPSNWTKMAAATMYTLFFAGNDFAPNTKVNGEPIQEYLQRHYIEAVKQVVTRVKDMPHVVGYDTMNEPQKGFIEWKDICKNEARLKIENAPTAYESMMLGSGHKQSIEVWSDWAPSILRIGRREIDPNGVSIWKDGFECVWKQNGVWDIDSNGSPCPLNRGHFGSVNGREVHFDNDYLRPFMNRYANAIREIDPRAIIFIESEPEMPPPHWRDSDVKNIVYAPHWYDGLTLFTKMYFGTFTIDNHNFRPILGHQNVRRSFASQLNRFQQWSKERLENAPVIIGEIGIPYDMHNRVAYRTGDFTKQIQAMDLNLSAIEANLLNVTLWNYAPDNSNEYGDNWNGEDLSIFSYDQQKKPADINSGGRATKAFVRPYPLKTAGEPLEMTFDMFTCGFTFRFRHDENVNAPTEIFVPNYQFPNGYLVEVSDGKYEIDKEKQRLRYWYDPIQKEHTIQITSPDLPAIEPGIHLSSRLAVIAGFVLLIRWFFDQIRN